ncbi:MAG: PcfJ domain-containing protein [Burkholderiaceae bacterium]|nr:PcfJ domain-containing protein [Burkholderiaceae bacterium]
MQDDTKFLREVERIFAFSYVRHAISSHSIIRQLLVIAFPDTSRQVARIYLLTADGLVHGFELVGHSQLGTDLISRFVDELVTLIHLGDMGEDIAVQSLRFTALMDQKNQDCMTMQRFQHAPYAPVEEFLSTATNSICISLLRIIEAQLSPEKLWQLHAIAFEHFPMFSAGTEALQAFKNLLDPKIIAQIEELECAIEPGFAQLATYNFLAAGDPTRKRNRMQALCEFPWIASILIEYWPGKPKLSTVANSGATHWTTFHRNRAQLLSNAIDTGRPLIAVAADLFGVPKETIRWCARKKFAFNSPFSLHKIDTFLRVISMISPEKRPIRKEEWRDFRTAIESILDAFRYYVEAGSWVDSSISKRDRDMELLAMPAMLDILQQRFKEFAKMKITMKSVEGWLTKNFDSAHDFLTTLRNAMQIRCYGYYDPQHTILDGSPAFLLAWLAQHTLGDIVSISARWHREIQIELTRLFASPEELANLNKDSFAEWPLFLSLPFEFDDLRIVQLINKWELIEEGRFMQHCVGMHYSFCLNGTSQIFSIRAPDNTRLSTFEVCIGSLKGAHATISSHFGFKNALPSERCKNAAAALVDFLNSPQCEWLFERQVQFKAKKLRHEKPSGCDRVVEAVAWRCAFTNEQAGKSFLEEFGSVVANTQTPVPSPREPSHNLATQTSVQKDGNLLTDVQSENIEE